MIKEYVVEKKSVFGFIDRHKMIFLMTYSVACAILYALSGLRLLQILILSTIFITAFINPFMCLACSISSGLYSSEVFPTTIYIFLSLIVGVSFLLKYRKMLRLFQGIYILICSVLIITISYCVGVNSSLNVAILMLLCIFRILMLLNAKDYKGISLTIFGYISGALGITVYFMILELMGRNITTYGRLSFNGDIKGVAAFIAIPLIIMICTKLEGKSMFKNWANGFVEYFFILVFSGMLILTAARGIILAILIGLIVHLFISHNKINYLRKVIPVAIFVIAFIATSIDSETFRLSRLFSSEDFASGSGRIEIWMYYIKQVWSQGVLNILFGIGPGEISRIGDIGYYAHSTFLDFYFSYGIIGFIAVIVCEIKLFIKLAKNGNPIYITTYIVSIIMYSTHGSAGNITLFTLQLLLLLFSKQEYINRNLEFRRSY